MPLRSGRSLPAEPAGRHCARRRRQLGQCQRVHRKKGREATRLTAEAAAKAVGCSEAEVFLASTGVIGEPLDATKFAGVLDKLAASATQDFWFEAAKAIMTTDTYPKVATRSAEIGGVKVAITGSPRAPG